VSYKSLEGKQREIFLQVMAYFLALKNNAVAAPPELLRINIDGTAGTGKSFLISAITTALRELFHDELHGTDPVIRLAPTGISAYGIRGWTVSLGAKIPVREPNGFIALTAVPLGKLQTRWKNCKLLIIDEKSMIGRAQLGRLDLRLRQIRPSSSDETLGGLPVLLFGDFRQLPPIGDTPVFSPKTGTGTKAALSNAGRRSFMDISSQSVTLEKIFRQQGESAVQVAFRDALLRLRLYQTTEQDFELFSTRFMSRLPVLEQTSFKFALRLIPTKVGVRQFNTQRLGALNSPVVRCPASHNIPAASDGTADDAEGLEKEVLLAVGAKVMITRNLWTSKGVVNGTQGFVRKIWYSNRANPKIHLPSVVFVEAESYIGQWLSFN
jgi:ATP-dependent DNA helicase PIF1